MQIYKNGAIVTSLPASASFSGPSALTMPGWPAINCTLELNGEADINGTGDVLVSVNSGSLSGFLCGLVSLDGFPWTATIDRADLPQSPNAGGTFVPVLFNNLDITGPGGNCGGNTITANFTNGPTVINNSISEFVFAGSVGVCTVNGTLEATPYPSGDIDVIY